MSESIEYPHHVDCAIAERKAADKAEDEITRDIHNRLADEHADKAWKLSQRRKSDDDGSAS